MIDFYLNAKKTKMFRCNASEDNSSLNVVEIDNEFVKVLNDADSHRYLEKFLCLSATELVVTEFRNRKLAAWTNIKQYYWKRRTSFIVVD